MLCKSRANASGNWFTGRIQIHLQANRTPARRLVRAFRAGDEQLHAAAAANLARRHAPARKLHVRTFKADACANVQRGGVNRSVAGVNPSASGPVCSCGN